MSSKPTLLEFGFPESEADVYLTLNQHGEMDVPKIVEELGTSRTTIYDALNSLLAKGYIEYRKDGRNAYYKAGHPNKLAGLMEEKKRQTSLLMGDMEETIRQLTGSFNLVENKPGVRFFEGKEGIIDAYEGILDLGKDIYSIEDSGEMAEFIPEYIKTFIQKRIERGIYNYVVSPSTNPINLTDPDKKREARSVSKTLFPFSMDIKICGNTVQLITLKEETAVAIRIDDPSIAQNFMLIFNFFWSQAASGTDSPPSPSTPATDLKT